MDTVLGNNIRRLRLRMGWTQRQLADCIKVEIPRISDLERGVTADPRLSTLRKLARAFGVPMNELVDGSKVTV